MMKVITANKKQNLQFIEIARPQISHDECLVKVHAIGVNRADILQKQGKYPAPEGESPIMGLEICGEIVQCGEHVNDFSLNDRVFGLVAGGGYAEYVKIKTSQLISLPDNLSSIEGAAIAEVYLTAYQSLFTIAALKPNQSVLIHAGASGVGTAAIQLAKAKGCFTVVTVSNDNKAAACYELGADVVINYTSEDYEQWSRINQPNGYDVIVDVVGGEYVNKNINIAALDGHIVILSMLGGRFTQPIDIVKMLMKRISITGSTLRNRNDNYKALLVHAFKRDFYTALIEGKIKPVIDSVYPWHEAEKAHQIMEANKNIGKLILTIN